MRSDPQDTGHLRVPSSWNNPINSRPAEPTWPILHERKEQSRRPDLLPSLRFVAFYVSQPSNRCIYMYTRVCCILETRDRADPPIDRIKPNEQRPSSSIRTHRVSSLEYITTQTVSKKKIRSARDNIFQST